MDSMSDACFGHMQQLLRDWMRGARLGELTAVVILARHELARRGISFTYSINQTDLLPDSPSPLEIWSRG